jgi:uncharacterized protein (TIGR03067 family)
MKYIAAVAVAVGLLAGADEPKQNDTRSDVELLKGTWSMVALTLGGRELPEGQVSSSTLTVDGSILTITWMGRDTRTNFVVDASTQPKSIDITFRDGPLSNQTVKGIYKFEDGKFLMCRAAKPEAERPDDFTSRAGSGRILSVFRKPNP